VKYCKTCILPDTRPGIFLDEEGICSGCHGYHDKAKTIDWCKRALEFEKLIFWAKKKSTSYDCIIPVSGGKDSWYQVIKAKEAQLKVLCVTWKTPGRTKIGQKNLNSLIAKLNVDHIDFTIDPEVEKKFMIASFEQKGATGIPMHMAIFSIPMRLAAQLKIPLVIWGENPQLEYGGNRKERLANELDLEWISTHGVTNDTSLADWIGQHGLTSQDLEAYRLPSEAQLSLFKPRSIFLGSYFEWDSFENAKIARQHGFESDDNHLKTGLWHFADLDCHFISLHHYLKWFKFGFTRSFDNLSIEIRQGLMDRNAAIKKLTELGLQQPHVDIEKFCEFSEKNLKWFWDIAELHRNKEIWKFVDGTWKIPNFLIKEWKW